MKRYVSDWPDPSFLPLPSPHIPFPRLQDINIVSVAPNDSLVATGSQDKTCKLWHAADLSLSATLSGHRRGVWDARFSPHDRVIATASGDKTLRLWSLADGACVRVFEGHAGGGPSGTIPRAWAADSLCRSRWGAESVDRAHLQVRGHRRSAR